MKYVLITLTTIAGGLCFQTNSHNTHPGSRTTDVFIVETTTDSTKPVTDMSTKEKMDAHIVHFTGAVMSDTFVISHFSRAFYDDQYSELLKPGKYNNGSKTLTKSISSSLDGIAIPKKTRLVVYNNVNLTGTKILDITGPAIINNNMWQSSEFYSVANKKTFRRDLQEVFPQNVRRWDVSGINGMSNWTNFSFEILVVP
jgi:hypothetical protein